MTQVTKRITEKNYLKWYGHLKRMDDVHMLRRMVDAPVPGKRPRGRQKTRWKDLCKRGMDTVGLKWKDILDRITWKRDIQNHSGNTRWWEKPEKRRTYFLCRRNRMGTYNRRVLTYSCGPWLPAMS